MKFRLDYNDKFEIMEFDSLKLAVLYILKNSFKFTNWSIFKDDYVNLSVQKSDGDFYICGYVDLNKNEFAKSSLYKEEE